jgi:hypothetical protein
MCKAKMFGISWSFPFIEPRFSYGNVINPFGKQCFLMSYGKRFFPQKFKFSYVLEIKFKEKI